MLCYACICGSISVALSIQFGNVYRIFVLIRIRTQKEIEAQHKSQTPMFGGVIPKSKGLKYTNLECFTVEMFLSAALCNMNSGCISAKSIDAGFVSPNSS